MTESLWDKYINEDLDVLKRRQKALRAQAEQLNAQANEIDRWFAYVAACVVEKQVAHLRHDKYNRDN